MRKVVKRRREALGLSQQEVAQRIGSSQSRVAKMEAGADDASLDLLARYLFAVGGTLRESEEGPGGGVGGAAAAGRTAGGPAARGRRRIGTPVP